MDLLKRMTVTQATVDQFRLREFVLGESDCVQLMVAHAKRCGVKIKVPAYGDWESAAAAMRALDFTSIAQGMDKHFRRIDPGNALMGDFFELPGGNGFTALHVAVGNGNSIGFQAEIPFAEICGPTMISGAWSVDV